MLIGVVACGVSSRFQNACQLACELVVSVCDVQFVVLIDRVSGRVNQQGGFHVSLRCELALSIVNLVACDKWYLT